MASDLGRCRFWDLVLAQFWQCGGQGFESPQLHPCDLDF
jgi:hypothetical protein